MKDMMFGGYIARNHVGNNLTDRELRVLKDGDIDAMVSTFVKMRQEEYILQLKCVLKSLKHYLGDEMTLEKITIKEEYEGDFIGSQMMDGDMDIFFGIIGSDEVLLKAVSYTHLDVYKRQAQQYLFFYGKTVRIGTQNQKIKKV